MRLFVGCDVGLAGQAVSDCQVTPEPHVRSVPSYAATAAAIAAESADVLTASRRQYAHPTSTTRPSNPSIMGKLNVMKMIAWPFSLSARLLTALSLLIEYAGGVGFGEQSGRERPGSSTLASTSKSSDVAGTLFFNALWWVNY